MFIFKKKSNKINVYIFSMNSFTSNVNIYIFYYKNINEKGEKKQYYLQSIMSVTILNEPSFKIATLILDQREYLFCGRIKAAHKGSV